MRLGKTKQSPGSPQFSDGSWNLPHALPNTKSTIESLTDKKGGNFRDINIRQNARIQYLEDAAIRHENKLIRVIQRMQCDQRRAKHAQAVSTAQYNGWLAASQLGLRQCIKLIAAGNIVSALEL
ncbi:hypothetical protein OUZ56_009710 [Daphnia magna]|uniref:Uncharacterized protein n=1 Tax=Daphnia magna TaxID=35525 RepID=A0ABR0AGY6_9CRUS|nr:hypothetical protein OUZ56_009710 [Daphnia magna]